MMNRLMSRYKGLILSCMSVMLIVFCVCSLSIESKASTSSITGQEFKMNFPRPTVSDTQGYIHLLLHNPNSSGSGYYVQTFFWSCYATTSDGSVSPCNGYVILSSDSMQFVPWGNSNSDSAFYVLSAVTQNGTFSMQKYSSSQRYTFNPSSEIVGFKYGGNALVESSFSNSIYFTVYYTEDESAELLYDVLNKLSQLHSQNVLDTNSILNKLDDILDSSESVEDQLIKATEYLKTIEDELADIGITLDEIFARVKSMISQQKTTNTWLEKIWNSIQEFITPNDDDKEESDKIENETNDKTNQLDSLNEQNKTEKEDIGSASSSVDSNVDLGSIENFGSVLACITENEYILQILLLVFSVALVGYVLFGKR